MRGYKGMTHNMKCRGMQFEVGKTYHVDGKIELCKNGLHFCQRLADVFYYYDRENGNRFFEVETDKPISFGEKKIVTSELTILRELTGIEVNRGCYGDGDGDGYGYGNGDGYGNAYSDGCGDDYGDGCGNGYGNGCGNGYGNAYGDGDGNGYGNGDGYGNGGGDGWGYGYSNVSIKEILIFNS